jgi:sugar/nucleoside kinase (ribokinase family)
MDAYDIAFVGHVSTDQITSFEGQTLFFTGGSAFFSAMAAAATSKKIAMITKMSEADIPVLDPVKAAGVDIFLIPAPQTTRMQVIHPTSNVDEREMFQPRNAGFIAITDMPLIESAWVHFAGLTDQDFNIDLMRHTRRRVSQLSVDMQSFVRQVDPVTRKISFRDVPQKIEILKLVKKVKVDSVEARILTGNDDLEKAAIQFEQWGCEEIIITRSDGVLARHKGETRFERFSNRNIAGRTGRGDTVFGAFLSRRLDYGVAESLKFAAALASIKMEQPGPFTGRMEDVLERIRNFH